MLTLASRFTNEAWISSHILLRLSSGIYILQKRLTAKLISKDYEISSSKLSKAAPQNSQKFYT